VVPATCYVDLSAQVIGDVELGENASVWMNAVLIGMGATILNDARIGEGSIVAAGAVIAEHTAIPPNSLVAGVPGKVRRTLGDEDRKLILRYAQDYLDYVAIYLRETE
jgi:carbonic anhydrase/acetyltransferase-like protein (isoleucine patch superfamily)